MRLRWRRWWRRFGKASGKHTDGYSSLPLQGDSRPQSEDVVRGEQLALEKAGGKAGNYKIKYVSLDDAIAATGKWDPARFENARKVVGDDNDDRLPRRVQLGRIGDLGPAAQRGRHPAGLAVEHLRGPDAFGGRREGRAAEVPAVGQRRRSAASSPPTTSRRGAGRLDEGRGRHQALHPERQGGLREGHRRPGREDRRRAGHRGPRQRRHRHQGRELPLAGIEDQERRR